MQGQIAVYNEEKKAGSIIMTNGPRFIFYIKDWQDAAPPQRGMMVNFETDENDRAIKIQVSAEIINNSPAFSWSRIIAKMLLITPLVFLIFMLFKLEFGDPLIGISIILILCIIASESNATLFLTLILYVSLVLSVAIVFFILTHVCLVCK
jgi:hypothetical protein